MYTMKKNNVERVADTESAKQNLERLGYKVVIDELKTEAPSEKMEVEVPSDNLDAEVPSDSPEVETSEKITKTNKGSKK